MGLVTHEPDARAAAGPLRVPPPALPAARRGDAAASRLPVHGVNDYHSHIELRSDPTDFQITVSRALPENGHQVRKC